MVIFENGYQPSAFDGVGGTTGFGHSLLVDHCGGAGWLAGRFHADYQIVRIPLSKFSFRLTSAEAIAKINTPPDFSSPFVPPHFAFFFLFFPLLRNIPQPPLHHLQNPHTAIKVQKVSPAGASRTPLQHYLVSGSGSFSNPLEWAACPPRYGAGNRQDASG